MDACNSRHITVDTDKAQDANFFLTGVNVQTNNKVQVATYPLDASETSKVGDEPQATENLVDKVDSFKLIAVVDAPRTISASEVSSPSNCSVRVREHSQVPTDSFVVQLRIIFPV